MKKTSLELTWAAAATAVTLAAVTPAQAHINVIGPLKDRGGDQKTAPCGGAQRSATPYTFEPGAVISLSIAETVKHDGYFRISFDDDGADFKDPESIDPINPNRYGTGQKCQGTAQDNCGEPDFCNVVSTDGGAGVLWDNLNPHLGTDSEGEYTWTVKLPDVECGNCTIQIQQVMEDPLGFAHGPFDGERDLYYRCVDIVLKKGAGDTTGLAEGEPDNEGIDCIAEAGGSSEPVEDAGAGEAPDAGTAPPSDASAPSEGDVDDATGEEPEDDASSDDREDESTDGTGSTGGKTDAGASKRDAGSADDEGDDGAEDDDGAADDEGEEDDDAESGSSNAAAEDGCNATGAAGGRNVGLALGGLLLASLVSRRRRRA